MVTDGLFSPDDSLGDLAPSREYSAPVEWNRESIREKVEAVLRLLFFASPKISRSKALAKFSRYRAAQEAAAARKLDLNRLKQRVGLLPRFCERYGLVQRRVKHRER